MQVPRDKAKDRRAYKKVWARSHLKYHIPPARTKEILEGMKPQTHTKQKGVTRSLIGKGGLGQRKKKYKEKENGVREEKSS